MKKILNIVVTGGPCGGKTTVLEELTTLLRGYGYSVYIVNEAATQLINSGIKPYGDYKIGLRDFQSILLDTQLANEYIRKMAVEVCDNPKMAILYDRGILDNRGYIDDETFNEFLDERGMSESEILTRYDLVIHLVTAAIGKEEYYTTANNAARTETIEEARLQDRKTMEAWRNHPNLKVVGNDTLFPEKVSKVKNIIRAYIGEDEVIRNERYLIDASDIDLSHFNHTVNKESVEEFIIHYDDLESELYMKSTINNSSYYTCIKTKKDTGFKVCRMISEVEYEEAKSKTKGTMMHKERYSFIDGNERFRLDFFDTEKHIVILERDVVDENRKTLPSFIKNATNITGNRDYDDDSIYVDYNIHLLSEDKILSIHKVGKI